MTNTYKLKEYGGLTIRLREGHPGQSRRLIILLHGWTGDENSMGIFSENIPSDYWVIAPRGIFPAGHKGYSWRDLESSKTWDSPRIDDFKPAISMIESMLDRLSFDTGIPIDSINIMGFSQGAALATSILLTKTQKIKKSVLLAGFLPEIPNFQELTERQILKNKQIFIAHGNLDETIPISKSILMAESLESMGAEISFCSDDVGHKVGRHCFKGLLEFLEN
jgi:phospholipase/carboxylesterase